MSSYYFTVSSLPFLRYEDAPSLSLEDFHNLCAPWLNPADHRLVLNTSISALGDTLPTCGVLQRWRQWEINLRNELAKIRAQKLGTDPFRYTVPAVYTAASTFTMGSAELAAEAAGMINPLEAESLLNRARWQFLEELEVGHYFDVERLVIYSLKLQLLERIALHDQEKGREQFEEIFGKLNEKIGAGES